MEKFNYNVLSTLIGESVEVFDHDSEQKLTNLVIAEVKRGAADGDRFDAFAVAFKDQQDCHCPQANYLFKHAQFGSVILFMVPHAIDEYKVYISRNKVG